MADGQRRGHRHGRVRFLGESFISVQLEGKTYLSDFCTEHSMAPKYSLAPWRQKPVVDMANKGRPQYYPQFYGKLRQPRPRVQSSYLIQITESAAKLSRIKLGCLHGLQRRGGAYRQSRPCRITVPHWEAVRHKIPQTQFRTQSPPPPHLFYLASTYNTLSGRVIGHNSNILFASFLMQIT